MIDLIVSLGCLVFCAWVAVRVIRRFGPDERVLLWVSFVAHQFAGVVNIWVTKFYYGYGDMMSYYRFGLVAAERLRADFWTMAPDLVALILHQNEPLAVPLPVEALSTSSGSMQGIAAFAMYLLFDSLYGACVLIAGAAFLSKLALYAIAREELPDIPRRPLLCACMLLPSALFWSCSLLKEPIAMIGALAAVYGFHQVLKGRRRLRSGALIVIGCAAVIVVKGYIFPAMGLAAGAWYIARKVHDNRGDITFKAGHVAVASIAAICLVVATGALLPQFAPDVLTDQLASLQTVGSTNEGGTNYSLGQSAGAGSASTQAALAPLALLTALFRPVVFEVKSPIVFISALEMSLFVVGAWLVFVRRGVLASVSELVRRPFLSFCAMFVLVFGTCVGLGTTNLGTLSRYRMPLTPFFAVLLMALIARIPVSVEIKRAVSPRGPALE